MSERGPLHPATRLGRVLQQVRSFTTLHASELEGLAAELDAAGQDELAARLRIFRDLHSQEAGLVLDELADIQTDLDRDEDDAGSADQARASAADPAQVNPASASPKRARWLAEQARLADEARRPRSRRDLFRPG